MKPLLVIVGETASGKSKLAMALAKRLNGEIICADSWTVRREVNIGTDKPSVSDRDIIPHHLVDIAEPCADFTAAVFKDLANKAIEDISSRGKLPIMVGGSGLYIDSVLYNFSFLEPGDRELRQRLNQLSLNELRQVIRQKNIIIGNNIDQQNKRRLIRLIETGGKQPVKEPLRPNSLLIGTKQTAEELKHAINERVESMISRGLEREVRDLSERFGWDCEALKGVGYKQWREHFEGNKTSAEIKQEYSQRHQQFS